MRKAGFTRLGASERATVQAEEDERYCDQAVQQNQGADQGVLSVKFTALLQILAIDLTGSELRS